MNRPHQKYLRALHPRRVKAKPATARVRVIAKVRATANLRVWSQVVELEVLIKAWPLEAGKAALMRAL